MTPQEAIELLENQNILDKEYNLDAEAIETAIEALKKQVQKKPTKRFDSGMKRTAPFCPACGELIDDVDGKGTPNWSKRCAECGQLLDWSDLRKKPVKENTIPVEALEDYIEKRARGEKI